MDRPATENKNNEANDMHLVTCQKDTKHAQDGNLVAVALEFPFSNQNNDYLQTYKCFTILRVRQ